MLFGVIVIPITFLGCTYYAWQALEAVRWLQVGVLANPLVYVSEGLRAALTDVPHMTLLAVYPVMVGFTALFMWRGISGFTKRVIA
jgi:ABC-2 type transport system permease protein